MSKAIVVLSGGQDSTTCLLLALALKAKGVYDEIVAVTFDYGQRHVREIQAAREVAQLCGIEDHETITIGEGILAGTSPLTNKAEALEQYSDFKSMDAIIGNRVEKTFVPMRNALFLTVAANRAVVKDAVVLITGVCQADNANYPDCRSLFIRQQMVTINEALGYDLNDERRIQIWTPLMNSTKDESVKMVADMGTDAFAILAFTHTAYDGQYPPIGNDHATILRAHGFAAAGQPDPLVLRAVMAGLMPRPDSLNYAGVQVDRNGVITLHGETKALYEAIQRHEQRLGFWDAKATQSSVIVGAQA